ALRAGAALVHAGRGLPGPHGPRRRDPRDRRGGGRMSALDVAERAPARTAQAGSGRVGPARAFAQTMTLAWRSLVQIRHTPMDLLDLSVQPLMFVVLFAYVFGGAISGSPRAYLEFGLPGIIVQNALFLTLNTAIGLNTDLTKGIFDRFRSLPIARMAPLSGRI